MGNRLRKLRRRLLFTVLALAITAGASVAGYVHQGGDVKDLLRYLQALDPREAKRPEGLRARLEAWLEKGASRLRDVSGGSAEGPPAFGDGSISVYFAPCKPLNPMGIDDRFLGLLERAEKSICGAFYDLELEEAADILIARHEAGVDVGLVSDTDYKDRDAIVRCAEAGIRVVFDERDAFMHNKFCVVDDAYVWTGSTNLTSNGMYRNNNNALLIESERLAASYSSEFTEMFRDGRFGARSPKNAPYHAIDVGGVPVECYFAPEDGVRREILAEIKDAGKSIDFMAFSFTSSEIAEAMAKRAEHGVRIRGLFEKRSAGSVYSRDGYLAARGATIRLDTNQYTMHHKVIVIDGGTVITGSYNFSNAAEKKNDENVLIIHSPGIAKAYTAEFERLMP